MVSREITDELSTGSQAASILFRSVISGFSSLIEEPRLGLSREGSLGAIKGLFKGLVTLIALPVAGLKSCKMLQPHSLCWYTYPRNTGTLDAVSVVTDGVRSSLQGRPKGRMKVPSHIRESMSMSNMN
jgi:hypothetical protein